MENRTSSLTDAENELYNGRIRILADGKELLQFYSIALMLDGQPIQPDGNVKVKIKLSGELSNYNNLQIIYIDADNNIQLVNSQIEGDYITFIISHFSDYAIIGTAIPESPPTGDGLPVELYLASACLLLPVMGVTVKKYYL